MLCFMHYNNKLVSRILKPFHNLILFQQSCTGSLVSNMEVTNTDINSA